MATAKSSGSTKSRAKGAKSATAEVARSYFEALGARDEEAAASHRAPDAIGDLVPIGVLRGAEEARGFFHDLFAAFPDFELVIEAVLAEGDVAVVRWRTSGTFTGAPFQGLEPTGRRVETRGMDWVEVEDGKIKKIIAYYDGLAFARGIGMMPPRDSSAERAMFGAFNGVTKLRAAVRDAVGG